MMNANIKKISLLIHGPYEGNAYNEIFESIDKIDKDIREIVVSTYIADYENTEKALSAFKHQHALKVMYSKDLINPGYFNLNRQIVTVNTGLSNISDDAIVIKLRNDQWCDMLKLIDIIKNIYVSKEFKKIISTNCYTRQDRLYHPSDMFLCGWKEALSEYYSIPLQEKTHLDCQLEMIDTLRTTTEEFKTFLISPESELFRGYLKLKDWKFLETEEDSYNALKKYIYLINTWDINLRWIKARNAFLPGKTIILPYTFSLAPFLDAPLEHARCYARHNFQGHVTLRDIYFLIYSRGIFSIKYNFLRRCLKKIARIIPRRALDFLGKINIIKRIVE